MANTYVNINTGIINENVPTKKTLEEKLLAQKHSASDIISGVLPVERGGTGNSSVDNTPTANSTRMCTSGGIYTAVNELKTSVSNGKSLIASAITDKGVSTASDATFQTMANNIRSINSLSTINLNSVDGKLFDYGVATIPVIDRAANTIYTAGTSLSADRDYIIYNITGSGYSNVYLSANTNNHTLLMRMSRIVFRNGLLFFEQVFSESVGVGGNRNLGFTMTNNDIYSIIFNFDYIGSRILFY